MSKALTGSRASVKLNGVKVAFASGLNVNVENTLTDIDVLDQLETAEFAETGHKCNFSVNLFKIDENSAEDFGFDPANIDELLSQAELTFEVFDRLEDKVRFTITGVKNEGGSGTMDARGVWNGTWNFKGRRGKGL